MTDMPARASAVVIGAGIVGNSLVHHLALLGWRDVVLLDKGPLPNPGGSTGHASNFIFPIEYSRLMFELTRDSTEQYKALGVFTESGGIEVARTQERMQELRRRTTQAKAWGIPAEILTPEGVQKLVPYLDPSVILGGGYFPTVGVVDSLRAGTLMREQAQASGALTVVSGAEVLDITTAAERVTGVVTSEGEIATENVVICCGVWSPKVAALAGARLALTPAVHQMISVGPIGLFAGTTGEISYPIVRDVDEGMYERQHGGDMEVGSYMHRPIIVPPETIPSNEEAVLSPTELPFTADDFDPQLAASLELMPELLGDEKAGIRYAINGLISMTPDGHPLLGETPEVKGLWAAAASWIKEGPGCGRAVAELMSGRVPTVDVHEAAVSRFYPSSRTTGFARARAAESFNKMYGIVHPAEQYESERPLRTGPLYERARELGAVFRETARWERPHWYASNEPLLATYAGRLMDRPAEWDSRWWSPIINAEHLAMREAGRPGRPVRVHHPRRHRPGGAGRAAARRRRPARRAGRPDRLHAVPQPGGPLRGRPHDHAARREPLPRRHRRRRRRPGRPVDQRPAARRRAAGRRLVGVVHDRALGTPRPGCPRGGESRWGPQSPRTVRDDRIF